MNLFLNADRRQWLLAAALVAACGPNALAQSPVKPGMQVPAKLGPQTARPIQQVSATSNAAVQRNNPMRPAQPPQITVDPNAPKSDIQRQLEVIYEQNGMEAPNMNIQMAPMTPMSQQGASGGGVQQTSVAQATEEQSGNRFTGFFKKLVGAGPKGPKPTPAGKQAAGLSSASAPSPATAPPAVPPVVDGLFDDAPYQPTVQAPAPLPAPAQAQPLMPAPPQYQPQYQAPAQPQSQATARPPYQQPQSARPGQPQYRPQPQYANQPRPGYSQPQPRGPYAPQPQYPQPRPQYAAQPRPLPAGSAQPSRIPAAPQAVASRPVAPVPTVTPEAGLPPSPAPYSPTTVTAATTYSTPACLPAATTKAQPVVKSAPELAFADPVKVTFEPPQTLAPQTRMASVTPRSSTTVREAELPAALPVPVETPEPEPVRLSPPAAELAAAPVAVEDPLGDFPDPFTEVSETEADGGRKVAARPATPLASPAAAPVATPPVLKVEEPQEIAQTLPKLAPPPLRVIQVPEESGAPVLLPEAPRSLPLDEEAEEEIRDPFEAELDADDGEMVPSIRKSSDAQPKLVTTEIAQKTATPAPTGRDPFADEPVATEALPPAPKAAQAQKLPVLPEVPAPIATAETEPAKPLPADLPTLSPVPQIRLDAASTKSRMERIRSRSGTIGLKGFCPVKLRDQRELVDAQAAYEATYRGQKFLFSDIESKAKFEQNPTRYAPAAYGADVVALLRDKDVVEGTLDYAAWYKGRLYLFGSQASHDTFVDKPEDFADGESLE